MAKRRCEEVTIVLNFEQRPVVSCKVRDSCQPTFPSLDLHRFDSINGCEETLFNYLLHYYAIARVHDASTANTNPCKTRLTLLKVPREEAADPSTLSIGGSLRGKSEDRDGNGVGLGDSMDLKPASTGATVGSADGIALETEKMTVGSIEEISVGDAVGNLVGFFVGNLLGLLVENPVGDSVGLVVGLSVDEAEGCANENGAI
jgi:hypothetical protein